LMAFSIKFQDAGPRHDSTTDPERFGVPYGKTGERT
jgi:hypothetical protein